MFETWVLNEFCALNSWQGHGAQFYYWRTPSGTEVDLIWKRGKQSIGFEIKSTNRWKSDFNKGLYVLMESGEIQQAFGVYRGERRLKASNVTVLPYKEAIHMAQVGEFT